LSEKLRLAVPFCVSRDTEVTMDSKYWCSLCEVFVEPERRNVSDSPWSYTQEHIKLRLELRCPYCGGEIPHEEEGAAEGQIV